MLTLRIAVILSVVMNSAYISNSYATIITRGPQLVEKDGGYYIKVFCPENTPVGEPLSVEISQPWTATTTQSMSYQYIPARGILNVATNNVGLDKFDTCAYAEIPSSCTGINPQRVVVCKSGRVFPNVYQSIRSSTGTPSYLRFSNYIGDIKLAGTTRMSTGGSDKSISFCNGPCKPKQ